MTQKKKSNIIPFPITPVIMYTPEEDLNNIAFFRMIQLLEKNIDAMDEALKMTLGHLSEERDVRDVVRAWEESKAEMKHELQEIRDLALEELYDEDE